MEFSKLIFPFHLLLLLNGGVFGKPMVEIVEYFGSLSVKIGKHQEIKCTVENPESNGVFTWKIGDKEFANVNRQEIEEDVIEYTLSFTTAKEYDGEEVSCNYEVDGELFRDSITINAYNLDVETGPETTDTVNEGDPVTLVVSANIYPAPDTDHITWNIRDSAGDIVNTLNPGQTQGQYSARQLQTVGDDMYSISLDIAKVDEEEMARQHEAVIKVETGGMVAITKTVEFNLAMKSRGPQPIEPKPKDGNPEEPVTFGSTSFVVIIVIIIVIVIMICIGCFCYKKKQKSNKTETNSFKNDYLPVSTNANNVEKIDHV